MSCSSLSSHASFIIPYAYTLSSSPSKVVPDQESDQFPSATAAICCICAFFPLFNMILFLPWVLHHKMSWFCTIRHLLSSLLSLDMDLLLFLDPLSLLLLLKHSLLSLSLFLSIFKFSYIISKVAPSFEMLIISIIKSIPM